MSNVTGLLSSCRGRRLLDNLLWFLIALGIVPAIISQNLIPHDIFSLRFGIETPIVDDLPRLLGLTVFAIGAIIAVARSRLRSVAMLLPWLAIGIFEVELLSAQLPTYSEVQEQLRLHQNQSRESDKPPSTESIRADIAQIKFSQKALLVFDEDLVQQQLEHIDRVFELYGGGLETEVAAVSKSIAKTSRAINLNRSLVAILRIREAQLKPLLYIPFANLKSAYKHTQREIRKLQKSTRQLQSKRNALHAKLDGITQSRDRYGIAYEQLFKLRAEVKTHLWISRWYQNWYQSLPYKLLCLVIILVLIWRFSLSSWFYLSIVMASLGVSFGFVEATLAFKLWVVLKFVIFSMLVKAAYLVFSENYPLLRAQTTAFLAMTLGTTLKYYLPILVLVAIGFVVSVQIGNTIDEQLYASSAIVNSNADHNTRRYDIDIAIHQYFRKQEQASHAQLDDLSKKSGQKASVVAAKTVAIYQDLFKPKLPQMNSAFSVPSCDRFYHWITRAGKCVEKEVKLPINDTYSDTQARQLARIRESSRSYATQGNNELQSAIRIAKRDLTDSLLVIRSELKQQLRNIYSVIDFYGWISAFVLVMVMLKSFLYIFSRIFFATEKFDPTRAIQFEPAAQLRQRGSVKEIAGLLKLTAKMGTTMFVNKKYDFANAPPDEVTPQPINAFFSRAKNKVWHLNRIDTAERENSRNTPYRRIPENERIVIWTLKPGDRVVFSWKTFVGMNSSVKIKTQYSWQLSSLIFGRMFFVVASVDPDSVTDGKVLLVAKGNDGIEKSDNPSNSPEQLLAWQTTTRFQLKAMLNFRNIYRSGVQIKAKETDLAVMHLSDGKPKSGASIFLKYFLVPI